jgi:uncharacterized protein (TIGR02246 family)
MRPKLLLACASLGLAMFALAAYTPGASAAEDDVALIRQQCKSFVEAWNRHDAKAMAAVYLDDADAVNPLGQLAEGVRSIEKQIVADHSSTGPMRDSVLEVKEEPMRLLTPDVAISDASVVVTGAYGPDGTKSGPMSLHVTNVWRKVAGQWKIAATRQFVHEAQAQKPEHAQR